MRHPFRQESAPILRNGPPLVKKPPALPRARQPFVLGGLILPSFRRQPASGHSLAPTDFPPAQLPVPASIRAFPYLPSFRCQPASGHSPIYRHSGESRNLGVPHIYRHPHIHRHSGESRNLGVPHIYRHPHIHRHSGASRNLGVPHIYRHPHIHRHSGASRNLGVPHIYRHPHIHRHSGASRNLAPPPYSTFRRSNGPPAKPPEKSAIFNDTTPLLTVHKCCTLAPASPATRPRGVTFPQKPTRAADVHGDQTPPDGVSVQRQKASGETTGNHQETGFRTTRPKPSVLQPSSDPARTPLYSTGVCQATPRAFPPLYAGPAMGRGMEN